MTRSRRGRWAPIARGVLLLAAVLLLPLAATLQTPRESAAQTTGQDSLWAANNGIGACADPSSSAALASCFTSHVDLQGVTLNAMATDGEHVYLAGEDGGLSCPVADLGANCTRIMAGPWPAKYNGDDNKITSLAAADGTIWFGQLDGKIYRCPANLPYADRGTMPSQCVLLDNAVDRQVASLLLANGTLYAGLSAYKKQGLLWSCSPDTVNSCSTLDSYGNTLAYSLAAGGGYLWAGLQNGILWRCDLNVANACATWDTAGNDVKSLSYDGQGTLYAFIPYWSQSNPSVIWSCLTAEKNRCDNLLTGEECYSRLAAGAGSVFSSSKNDGLRFGTSSFTAADKDTWTNSFLVYLPADGPVGVGGVSVKMTARNPSQKIEKRCATSGKTPKGIVTITGPYDFKKTMKVGACDLVQSGSMTHRVDLLDPGDYTVTVQVGKHSGTASVTIVQDMTKPVNVKLNPGG